MNHPTKTPAYARNTELVRRYQAGDAQAAEELLAANEPLLMEQVKRSMRSVSTMEFDDLMQEARLGLLTAARKFDLSRGLKFATYATYWIYQGCQRAIDGQDRMIRLPSHVVQNRSRPEKHRVPEVLPSTVSLDAPVTGGEGHELFVEFIADPCDTAAEVRSREFVRWALADLRERERQVMERRLQGETLDAIAGDFGLTRERIRQIGRAAAAQIRCRLRAAGITSAEDLL
jgi:RNA polymerase sigma factor (sigma-70 family)